MNPALRVLAPGLLTTVQDLGRPGHQRLGVPVSGALDPVSLRAANALVGNRAGAGALEVAYVGPTLAVEADDVRLVLRRRPGADRDSARTSTRDERPSASTAHAQHPRSGAARSCGSARSPAAPCSTWRSRAASTSQPVLGSVSTYIRGGFGGWQGRALVAGDRLPLRRAARKRPRGLPARRSRSQRCRRVSAPSPARRTIISRTSEIAAFFDSEYTVCRGLRPHGHAAQRPQARPLPRPRHHLRRHRAGLDPGAGQRPADRAAGRPADHRRLSEDRDRDLGRPAGARPGADRREDRVRAGHRRGRSGLAPPAASPRSTRSATGSCRSRRSAAEVAPRLLDCNLVSGVVDARSWPCSRPPLDRTTSVPQVRRTSVKIDRPAVRH